MHLIIFPFVLAGLYAKIKNRKYITNHNTLSLHAKNDNCIESNGIPLTNFVHLPDLRETNTDVKIRAYSKEGNS